MIVRTLLSIHSIQSSKYCYRVVTKMSAPDVDAAKPTADKPVKPVKKPAAKPKKPASHPKYTQMIAAALGSLKERGGSSRQAVLKYIMAHYNVGKDERVVNQHLKMALRAGAKNGTLKQAKGTGASGSFRLCEKKMAAKKAAARKPKAANAAKKLKKAKTPKKATTLKKTIAKKPTARKLKAAVKPKKAAGKSKTTTAKKLKMTKAKKTPVKKMAKKA